MGQSTDAILFYGYCWEDEGVEPWEVSREEEDEDEEDDGEDYEDGDDGDEEDDEGGDYEDEEDEGDWEKRYCNRKGLREPKESCPDKGIDPKTGKYNKNYTPEELKIVDLYSKYFKEKYEMVAKEPCTVGTHCSYDYPMRFVAVRKSKTVSNRGSMSEIKNLDVNPEWDSQLKEFCKLMDIKVGNEKPKWWLVSLWG